MSRRFPGAPPFILQIGHRPPPLGGISRHVAALADRLTADGIPNAVLPVSRRMFLRAETFRLLARADVVHTHQISIFGKTLPVPLKPFGARIVLGLHGDGLRDQLRENVMFKVGRAGKAWLRLLLPRYDAFVVSNGGIADFLVSLGLPPRRIHVVPEFIPVDEPGDWRLERPDLAAFVGGRGHLFLSGDLRPFGGGLLYGFDFLLDALAARPDREALAARVCFLINLIGDFPPEGAEALAGRVRAAGLGRLVAVNARPLEAVQSLVRGAYAVLRPTDTDGNSVLVMEALHARVPVLASDAAPRPASCLLHRRRDIASFNAGLDRLLAARDLAAGAIAERFDSYERLRALYLDLAARGAGRA